jgi:MFS transporter, PAT family, beta-lactamase induction signal transducer AmpG
MLKFLSIYREINVIKVCLYGFVNGMSLLLSGNIINFWLASSEIDAKIIGFFAIIALPYALKYFIAIFIDNNIPYLIGKKIGKHKSWLIISQIMIAIILVYLSFLNPKDDLWYIALFGFFIALFSVVQEIVLNANRINILEVYQRPVGTAMHTVGYRLGMLFSGAGVIFSSIYLSWSSIYLILAVIYLVLTIVVMYFYVEVHYPEKESLSQENKKLWYNAFITTFQHFLNLKNFIWIVLFILLYRLSDNMLTIMTNPFLLYYGYTVAEIATISKFFGTIMVIIGGIISGPIISKWGVNKSLLNFSIIHMVGHFLFIILATIGKNVPFLYFVTAYEALTGGMVMTVYIAFISNLCGGRHTATQYAFLSSGIGISRVLFPMGSGLIVDSYGWVIFFSVIFMISVFTVFFTKFMMKSIKLS